MTDVGFTGGGWRGAHHRLRLRAGARAHPPDVLRQAAFHHPVTDFGHDLAGQGVQHDEVRQSAGEQKRGQTCQDTFHDPCPAQETRSILGGGSVASGSASRAGDGL
jgi:hypothetical protein